MKIKEIEEIKECCKECSLEDLNNSLLYWVKSINAWFERYREGEKVGMSKFFLTNCKKWAIHNAIMAKIILTEIELREKGFAIIMEPKKLQEFSKKFIDSILETCLYGGGEVAIESLENRKILVIKLAEICTYRSDSPYLQCAVNPSGDCRTCQFREEL